MKSGEYREVPDDEMRSFLLENKDRIQDRRSPRKRRPLRYKLSETNTTRIK